jgi:hypothetical protein
VKRFVALVSALCLNLSFPTLALANYESAQTQTDIQADLALHNQAEEGARNICISAYNVWKTILAERDGLFKDSTNLASYAYSMGVNVTALTNAMSSSAMTITNQMMFYTDTACPTPAPIQFPDLAQNLASEIANTYQLLANQSLLINQQSQALKFSNFTGLDTGLQALQSLKNQVGAFDATLFAENQMDNKVQVDYAADDQKAAADKAAADKAAADKAAADALAAQQASAKAKSDALKKTTITCVKGKLSKTLTGVKPVCPVGYKRK